MIMPVLLVLSKADRTPCQYMDYSYSSHSRYPILTQQMSNSRNAQHTCPSFWRSPCFHDHYQAHSDHMTTTPVLADLSIAHQSQRPCIDYVLVKCWWCVGDVLVLDQRCVCPRGKTIAVFESLF